MNPDAAWTPPGPFPPGEEAFWPDYVWPEGVRSAVLISVDEDGEASLNWRVRDRNFPFLAEYEQRRFGMRKGIYRMARLFRAMQIPATFFIPSQVIAEATGMVGHLVECGFEIGAHGHVHEPVDELSIDEVTRVFAETAAVFERVLGTQPLGYRSPAWELSPQVLKLIRDHGFSYDSSLMGADHPYTIDGITELPVQWFADDMPYFRHVRGDVRPIVDPETVLADWLGQFEASYEAGGLFVLTLHPWMSGHSARIAILERLLAHIRLKRGVWVAGGREIDDWHRRGPNGGFVVSTDAGSP